MSAPRSDAAAPPTVMLPSRRKGWRMAHELTRVCYRSGRAYPHSYPQAGRNPPELAVAHRSNRTQSDSTGGLPRFRYSVPFVTDSAEGFGKESNRLDETEDGIIRDANEVYVEYRDERREWEAAREVLRRIGAPAVSRLSGMAPRTLRSRLNSGRVPHRRNRALLIEIARQLQSNLPTTDGEWLAR